MGPLGWQWGDVGGGVFALKEVTVLVRAGSRWNYNPGLGHSQPAVRYFICPAQCFKQFETLASGLGLERGKVSGVENIKRYSLQDLPPSWY